MTVTVLENIEKQARDTVPLSKPRTGSTGGNHGGNSGFKHRHKFRLQQWLQLYNHTRSTVYNLKNEWGKFKYFRIAFSHYFFYSERGAFIIHNETYQPWDGAYNHIK